MTPDAGGVTGPPGRLAVVGTPIGNLEDISRRAVRVLGEADVIFCEDTRRTRKLLSALGLRTPRMIRLDAHNEAGMAASVIAALDAGRNAALVTDAGMPAVSDPGARLVAAVAAAGHEPEVVPGPTAVSAALALSGLPGAQYRFAGFLPRKGRERAASLAEVAASPATVVIYEAPSRVARTITDLLEACGPDRPFVAARELTKLHEEVRRETLGEAAAWVASIEPRGEWVLLVGPRPGPEAGAAPATETSDASIAEALAREMQAGADRRRAVAEVAAQLGLPKRRVYDIALQTKSGPARS